LRFLPPGRVGAIADGGGGGGTSTQEVAEDSSSAAAWSTLETGRDGKGARAPAREGRAPEGGGVFVGGVQKSLGYKGANPTVRGGRDRPSCIPN